MTQPWSSGALPPVTQPDTSVLIEGSTFCVSDLGGDIGSGYQQGLFVRDTRVLSRWELTIDGARAEPLAAFRVRPFHGTYLARARPRPGVADRTLVVRRDRFVGNGMREDVTIRNESATSTRCAVRLDVGSDYADLFEVKEGTASATEADVTSDVAGEVCTGTVRNGTRLECVIRADGNPGVAGGSLLWSLDVPARSAVIITVEVVPSADGVPMSLRHPRGQPVDDAVPAVRLREWRRRVPALRTPSSALAGILRQSVEDLGALRIFDPAHPDRAVVAAGAPWFMALFGRDCLLTSLMLAPIDSSLAIGTLQTLADHQGERVHPASEEEPGRILHEIRFGPATAFALGGRNVYYGTADATALFVILAAELLDWGNADAEVIALAAHVDRALAWITGPGDPDGDGFVEYERKTRSGLANQGWKDSWDGITFADGRIAQAPIALAEVQAYSYAAFLARAAIAERLDDGTATQWRRRAAELKERFNAAFWLAERGYFAVGLDRDKRPIDSVTSNVGHCLWTGIVEEEHAEQVAARLVSDDMFSGWGIRTLATSMAAYDPVSYHNGSVWPHDTAICVAGLRRYGFDAHARLVAQATLEAATHFRHRLPELFCGFARSEFREPVPYPTACSPQAWSAAAPLLLLRSLLGLEPDAATATLHCRPSVPESYLPLSISGLTVRGRKMTVEVGTDGTARIRPAAAATGGGPEATGAAR